jgi:hypothetical protein
LHLQRIFYEFHKFTDLNKIQTDFRKKRVLGRIQTSQAAQRRAGPDPARGVRDGGGFEPASGLGWSADPGYQIDTRRSRPSDQVEIDGTRSSSPRQKIRATARLGFVGNGKGSPRALLVVGEGVAVAVRASRGRGSSSVKQKQFLATAWSRVSCECSG